jgi:hypothetical protein
MLNRKNGYALHRPFYEVDPNAEISAGMVAFLVQSGDHIYATTASIAGSGATPVGTFWNDHNVAYNRTTLEEHTFSAALGYITVNKGNIVAQKVTSEDGLTEYTEGVDYSVTTANGIITNLGVGIGATDTVVVWYSYAVLATEIIWNGGSNYDRAPDDTQGSGKITVAEGDAKVYTDQFDVTQTFTLNAQLTWDTDSQWVPAGVGDTVCGRVIKVPSPSDPFLGVQQVTVA